MSSFSFRRADEETLLLMKSPRCSLPDQDQELMSASTREGNTRRRRRAAAMWTRRNINWRFDLHTQYYNSKKNTAFIKLMWLLMHTHMSSSLILTGPLCLDGQAAFVPLVFTSVPRDDPLVGLLCPEGLV